MHPCTVQPHASLFLFSSCSSGRARATTEDHRHLLVAVQYASVQAAGGAPLNHSTDEAKPLCTSYVFLSIVIPAATGRGAPVEKQKDSVQYERAPGYPRTTTYLSRVSWGGRNREDGGSVAQCGRLREQARTTTRRSRAPEDCAPEQRRSLRLRYLYLAMTACGPWLLTDHGCLPWPWPHADGDGPPCASRTRYPVASKTLLPRVCGAAGHTRFRSRDPRCPALGGWARRPLATVDQRPCTWTGGGSGFKPRRVWVGGGGAQRHARRQKPTRVTPDCQQPPPLLAPRVKCGKNLARSPPHGWLRRPWAFIHPSYPSRARPPFISAVWYRGHPAWPAPATSRDPPSLLTLIGIGPRRCHLPWPPLVLRG